MKEVDFKKMVIPFKDIFNNPIVTKAQSGVQDFVTGVKKLFSQPNEQATEKKVDINNYLKTPAEIEAEFRYEGDKQKGYIVASDNFNKPEFLTSPQRPNLVSLEEALAGEMEENY